MLANQSLVSADSGEPTGAGTPADALEVIQRMSTDNAENQEPYECPSCTDLFDTEQGMKVHHSMVHGESIAGVDCECVVCGNIFTVPPSTADGRQYCSEKCMSEDYDTQTVLTCEVCGGEYTVCASRKDDSRFCSRDCSSKMLGKERRDRVIVRCEICDTQLKRPRCEVEDREHHFCGHECYGEWVSENRSGENCPSWKGGDRKVVCAACGSETTQTRNNYKKTERAFCDRGCFMEWHSENMVGESHPRWKGGPAPYGAGWNEPKREAVRNRDGRECIDCGMTEADHVDKFGEKLHVHHVIPARAFDDPEERNAKNNLVTLCMPCHHGKWEGIPLAPQTD